MLCVLLVWHEGPLYAAVHPLGARTVWRANRLDNYVMQFQDPSAGGYGGAGGAAGAVDDDDDDGKQLLVNSLHAICSMFLLHACVCLCMWPAWRGGMDCHGICHLLSVSLALPCQWTLLGKRDSSSTLLQSYQQHGCGCDCAVWALIWSHSLWRPVNAFTAC